ncbi:MAG: RsmE family RNA methyltransferase, partial [Streptococcus orisratti]|uniref:16S rRNA (uracil(1498)-N(3))-methyltransferase n=1 Tax=Streptococcus orisratti TaxID=114652 RepID=UPI002A91AE46
MQQYFVKGRAEELITITDKDTAKHMFSVMRLAEGDEVVLVFEDGIKRLARVVSSSQQQLEIVQELRDDVELPVQVTIAMGFPKGDKLEFVAQKATELGMTALWAFPADWSVVKWDGKKLAKKEEKLSKIAQGAAEQSKRNVIPQVK